MAEINKTIVMSSIPERDLTLCPICNIKMEPAADQSGKLCCPRCGFVKIQRTMLGTGSIIGGKYRILNKLNCGGCGDIFMCHPVNDVKTRYVLKIMRQCGNGPMAKRFLREARILQMIQEPRIVKLIDCWSDDHGSYIILEYIDGKNLNELQEEFEFGEENVLIIIKEISLALKYTWDNFSIAHRDIKPDNIMLDNQGHIRLLDFGLSKSVENDNTGLTMESAGMGTPGFMSPEQFHDFKHADFRSDIFSLGATMFFLLTGEKPFSGENTRQIYENTLKNSPPPYQRLATKCSRQCIELIRWMMQKKIEDRPSSYDELLNHIDALLSSGAEV